MTPEEHEQETMDSSGNTQENHVRAMKVKKAGQLRNFRAIYVETSMRQRNVGKKKTPWKHPRLKSWRFLQQTQALRP